MRFPPSVTRMSVCMAIVLISVVGFASTSLSATRPEYQPSATINEVAVSLEHLLQPDGTLDPANTYRGSVSTAGWRMGADEFGRPRFVREKDAATKPGEGPASEISPTFVPGDHNWDARFAAPGIGGSVLAMAVDGSGNLYVGGSFSTVGEVIANSICKWDGTSWSAVGSGMDMYGSIWALAVDGNGILYAGGWFTTAGGVSASNCQLSPDSVPQFRVIGSQAFSPDREPPVFAR